MGGAQAKSSSPPQQQQQQHRATTTDAEEAGFIGPSARPATSSSNDDSSMVARKAAAAKEGRLSMRPEDDIRAGVDPVYFARDDDVVGSTTSSSSASSRGVLTSKGLMHPSSSSSSSEGGLRQTSSSSEASNKAKQGGGGMTDEEVWRRHREAAMRDAAVSDGTTRYKPQEMEILHQVTPSSTPNAATADEEKQQQPRGLRVDEVKPGARYGLPHYTQVVDPIDSINLVTGRSIFHGQRPWRCADRMDDFLMCLTSFSSHTRTSFRHFRKCISSDFGEQPTDPYFSLSKDYIMYYVDRMDHGMIRDQFWERNLFSWSASYRTRHEDTFKMRTWRAQRELEVEAKHGAVESVMANSMWDQSIRGFQPRAERRAADRAGAAMTGGLGGEDEGHAAYMRGGGGDGERANLAAGQASGALPPKQPPLW